MSTIPDHLDAFLADMQYRRRLRPNTLRAYRADLRQAGVALPMALADVTVDAIDAWLADATVAPSTRNRRAASLGRFFTWAQRQGLCASNPLVFRDPTPVPRPLPNPIRSAEHRARLDAAMAKAPQPYRLILTILRETGMRASEVLGLNLDDVCLDVGAEGLRLRTTKNGHGRIVVLDPDAMPRSLRGLRAWVRAAGTLPGHVPLFRSTRQTRVSYRALYHHWQHLCRQATLVDAAGAPLYTIHQLRHTRGTELIEAGVRMEIVQRILGHRDPRSTQGYVEISDRLVRQALAEQRSR
jgi:integrase/recombinase XerD